MRNFLVLFLTIIFITLSFGVSSGEVNVGGEGSSQKLGIHPGEMIKNYYNFALMIGGVLAFGMIVYAAFRFTLAAGNPSTQSDARDQIFQALLGLVVLLGVFFVLNVINPELTHMRLPSLREVESVTITPARYDGINKCEKALEDQCKEQGRECRLKNGVPECFVPRPIYDKCDKESEDKCKKQGRECGLVNGSPMCFVPQN